MSREITREIWVLQHPESRYGVVQSMTEELTRALSASPYNLIAALFSRGSKEYLQKMAELNEIDIPLLCRYVINQGIPDDIFFELFGIPYVTYILDAISHMPEIIDQSPVPRFVASFVDKDSQELYEKVSGKKAVWMPHAIDIEKMQKAVGGYFDDQWSNRPIDLLISGSWIDREREERFWKESGLSDDLQRCLYEIAHKVLYIEQEKNHLPLLHAMLSDNECLNKELFDACNGNIWTGYVSLEQYIRGMDRERLGKCLDGFCGKVVILTHPDGVEGWKKVLPSSLNIEYVLDVPYEETWHYYTQSKIVVNSVPTIKKGLHERLLAALVCGAKVITTPSTLIPAWVYERGYVHDMRAIASSKDIEKMMNDPLNDPNKIRQWIAENHTWKARINQTWPEIEERIQEIVSIRQSTTL